MFDGSSKKRANVSLRGKSREEDTKDVLRRAREQREQRAAEKLKQQAAGRIWRFYGRRRAFSNLKCDMRVEYEKRMADLWRLREILKMAQQPLPTPLTAIEPLLSQLLLFYSPEFDLDKLEKMACILTDSCRSSNAQWNFLSLRSSCPSLFVVEASRLLQLSLFHLYIRCTTPEDERRGAALLDLLEVLLLTNPASWSPGDAESFWRVALSLAVPPKPSGPPSRLRPVRPRVGLYECWRRELERAAAGGAATDALTGRAVALLTRLSLLVAGLSDGTTTVDTALIPPELQEAHRRATTEFARAVVGLDGVLNKPQYAQLLTSLRQNQSRGLWALVAAWDHTLVGSSERMPAAEEAVAVVNLLLICRSLLQQADLEAQHVPPLVRVLEYCISRVPQEGEGGVGGEKAGEAVAMDVSDDEDDDSSDRLRGASVAASVLGGTGGIEDAILSVLRSKRAWLSGSLGSAGLSEVLKRELSSRAEEAMRELCGGRTLHKVFDRLLPSGAGAAEQPQQEDAVLALCRLCAAILVNSTQSLETVSTSSRSGGGRMGGGESVMQVLNMLAYHFPTGDPFVQRLWTFLSPRVLGRKTWFADAAGLEAYARLRPALHLLFSVYSHQLMAVDDEEFYSQQIPLRLAQASEVVEVLRVLLHGLYWTDPVLPIASPQAADLDDLQLRRSSTKLFNQLYQRHTRRKLPARVAGESLWHWPAINPRELALEEQASDEMQTQEGGLSIENIFQKDGKLCMVLTDIPQVLPFQQRVLIFHRLLEANKRRNMDEAGLFGHRITVRRPHIYEDSFKALNHLGSALRQRIQVVLVSDLGTEEAGIDGGGVFKEFMDALTKRAFDPQYALFRSTPEHLLYPNPLSELAAGDEHLRHFEFIGRVLGKALYESILVEPQFALFFLQRLAGKLNEVDDLYSLDTDLYRGIMKLKAIKQQGKDVADLDLTFETTTDDDIHGAQTTELVPGGRNIAVTNENVFRYIQLVANYKLNVEINLQAQAFLRGFRDLIPHSWIRMFGAEELQLLITGQKRAIDIEDMRAHTQYSGGYHPSQPIIQWFWDALRSFTPEQQAAFLMFVTSCSRQPLLGFEQLRPQMCIQRVPLQGDDIRLPSSATCMNLLKLPAYTSPEMLREKLLYAITAGAGFELS